MRQHEDAKSSRSTLVSQVRPRRWVTTSLAPQPILCASCESMDQPRILISPKHKRLGELLREARVAAGLRQAKLAEMLGRKQAFVSKYEGGSRGLDIIDFLRIVKLTGCDVDHVMAALEEVEEEQRSQSTRRSAAPKA